MRIADREHGRIRDMWRNSVSVELGKPQEATYAPEILRIDHRRLASWMLARCMCSTIMMHAGNDITDGIALRHYSVTRAYAVLYSAAQPRLQPPLSRLRLRH